MDLARVSQAALERAVRETGLSLTVEQVRDIAETEIACLTACERISFGESAAVRLVREFAASSFIVESNAAEVVAELMEAFYELRETFSASITDVEILEALRESFDGDAAGDVDFAALLAADLLSKQLDYSTYEIADDDGNVYRWDPEEWHENVTADGWYGERWEDIDE